MAVMMAGARASPRNQHNRFALRDCAERRHESASALDRLDHLTACAEASGGEPAKLPGAAVERYREVPLYEAALLTIDASYDAPKTFERTPELENISPPPPNAASFAAK